MQALTRRQRLWRSILTVSGAAFAGVWTLVAFAATALAQTPGAAAGGGALDSSRGGIAIGIGIGLGIAAAGGAIGQGKAATAALEGIARNPGASDKVFTPLILSLALIESLVIYSLVISFTLVGKL